MRDDIEASLLDGEIRAELRTLGGPRAETVARHLVAAGLALDENPQLALSHARAARELAPRIYAVREAVGLAAYHAEEWVEAARELRAAHRMTGVSTHLAVLADIERALGRPERALELAQSPEGRSLPAETRAELAIVEAGARHDLGQTEAALLVLSDVDKRDGIRPWTVRLWYAHANLLESAGRLDEAADRFRSVVTIDEEFETDAEERIELLEAAGAVVSETEADSEAYDEWSDEEAPDVADAESDDVEADAKADSEADDREDEGK